MNIVLSTLNFNIPKISLLKSDNYFRAYPLKNGADTVSLGANIHYKKAKNIYKALEKAENIAILSHKDIDPDAISSGILFLELLKRKYKNKNIKFIVNQNIPKFCTNIQGISDITNYRDLRDKNFDAVVVLDCDETRVDCHDIFEKSNIRINIDHHGNRATNPKFSKQLRLVNPDAVSTTQLIYDNFFMPFGIWPNPIMIECIMTGVVADSGDFRNIPNPKDFAKSMDLLAYSSKEPLSTIVKKVKNNFDVAKQRSVELENFFTDTVEVRKNVYIHKTPKGNKINYILVNRDLLNEYQIKDNESEIKETINHILTMNKSKADIAVALWERENGETRLSMRSRQMNVLNIAEYFGGGGHKLAAGATVSGTFEEALEKVLKAFDNEC